MLIDRLIGMGARVKNPTIYASARPAGNVAPVTKTSEDQLRMLDTLAAQVRWKERTATSASVIESSKPRARVIPEK